MGLIGEALMGCCRMDTEVWMLTVDVEVRSPSQSPTVSVNDPREGTHSISWQ